MEQGGSLINPSDWCPYKDRKRDRNRHTQGEQVYVMMETELGVMDLQGNKQQGLLTNTRSKKKLGKILFHKFRREHGSADILNLDF